MIRTKQLTTRLATAALVLNAVFAIAFAPFASAQITPRDPNTEGKEISDGPAGTPCDTERALPCDRTPTHLVGLPDPEKWIVIGRGKEKTYYRRATSKEMEANKWDAGAFLVVSPGPQAAARGSRRATIAVPLDDRTVQEVSFVFDERVEGLEFYERSGIPGSPQGAVQSRLLTPVLYEYFNEGFDPRKIGPTKGAWARMISSDLGGIYASGLANGFEFEVDSSNGRWVIEPVPAPAGFVANDSDLVKVQVMSLGTFGGAQYGACSGNFNSPACGWLCAEMVGVPCDNNPHIGGGAAAHHCIDGLNNDFDGGTDAGDQDCQPQAGWGDSVHPGFPIRKWESGNSFVLFGEGQYCTAYASADPGSGGNWINRLTAMGWDSEALLNAAIGWQGVTGREKQVRYLAGACWVFESMAAASNCNENGAQCLNGYPYANSDHKASEFYNRVWDDVNHATNVGLNDALHMAQAVYYGVDYPLSCSEENGCCGAMLDGGGDSTKGASVVQYRVSAGSCTPAHAPISSAHEFGHTAGLDHNATQSFMHSPAFDSPSLPAADKNMLVGCVENANCPRPSGFRKE